MLSDADATLLAVAQALELAARDIYASALSRGSKTGDELALIELIYGHHVDYEQALNGVLSKKAVTTRDEVVFTKFSAMLADTNKTWSTLLELENMAISTHIALIEKIESAKRAALLGSIVMVEARHAAMLASLISNNLSLALDNSTQALGMP